MKLINKIIKENSCISWDLARIIDKKLASEGNKLIVTSTKVMQNLYRWKTGKWISWKWKTLITYAINQYLWTNYWFNEESLTYDLDKDVK
jgi:hypothetical protein